MRINVSISKDKLEKLDEYCEYHGMKRSTVLTRGAGILVDGWSKPHPDDPSIIEEAVMDTNTGQIKIKKYVKEKKV